MTSLGVMLDEWLINGELHHLIDSLLPKENSEAMYTQLYIYDGHDLNSHHERNPHHCKDVLEIIQKALEENNQLIQVYK